MSLADVLSKRRSQLGLTLNDIAKRMGVSEATVQRWESGNIKSLRYERIGKLADILQVSPAYIMGFDNTQLPSNILPLPETKLIPLIGTIACGKPILAEENIEEYIKADSQIPADYALKCHGDSMINARIYDGDVVFIRQQADVDDGEIAAVLIGDEATLKRVKKIPKKNKVVLSPCNPTYDDMVYSGEELADVRILGKAVAFLSIIR